MKDLRAHVFFLLIASLLLPLGCADEEAPEEESLEPGETRLGLQGPALRVVQQDPHGEYLTDADSMSLYLFMADSMKNQSNCYDACAEAWPPLTVEDSLLTGEGVDESLVSTIEREDGLQQVAYDGWPLYYFQQDQQPSETMGQDVEGFGAEWYLVSPEGEPVHEEEETGI